MFSWGSRKEENKKTCFLGDQEKKRIKNTFSWGSRKEENKKHVFLGTKKRRE